MTEPKTRPNRRSVTAFLSAVPDERRRKDCRKLLGMMKELTGAPPCMWGDSIVGFGRYRYRYASGRQGEWFLAGFSPRRQDLTIYVMSGLGRHAALLQKLGKHRTGKSCLYLKRLDDVDLPTLTELVRRSVAHVASSGS